MVERNVSGGKGREGFESADLKFQIEGAGSLTIESKMGANRKWGDGGMGPGEFGVRSAECGMADPKRPSQVQVAPPIDDPTFRKPGEGGRTREYAVGKSVADRLIPDIPV
jgi:hypothetical protein